MGQEINLDDVFGTEDSDEAGGDELCSSVKRPRGRPPARKLSRLAAIDLEIAQLREEKIKEHSPYIRGPIPTRWLVHASKINLAAVRVAHALWYISGLTRGDTQVRLNLPAREEFDLDHATVHRGLKGLEEHGLIRFIKRRKGSYPTVEILPTPAVEESPLSAPASSYGTID